MNNFQVYPKRGFLNTQYKIHSDIRDNFSIIYNGQKLFEGIIDSGETKDLPNFKLAGEYIIQFSNINERQKICVEDALRFGSSKIKDSYIFDDFPYIIFVMEDRIHFYDPTIDSYVFTENYLCPDGIKHIKNGKLLFITKHSSGVSISIFDTEHLAIIKTLEIASIISHSSNYSKLYVLSNTESSICIVDTESFAIEEEIHMIKSEQQDFFHFEEDTMLLHVVDNDFFYSIDVESNDIKKFEKKNLLGVTHNGYLIKCNIGNDYEYIDLKSSFLDKGHFHYNPLIQELYFDGFQINSSECDNNFKTSKKRDFYAELKEEFILESKEKISKGDESLVFRKEIEWNHIDACVSFFPTKEGVYVVEKINSSYANNMIYYKRSDRVLDPRKISKNRLLWISSLGYEICYDNGNNSSGIRDIDIKNNLALFSVNNSSLYLFVKSGILQSTYNDKKKAIAFVSQEKEKEVIMIDGKEVPHNTIICKSSNKLIVKTKDSYVYYKLSNNSDWKEVKIIDFKEEKHTCAKMSTDGKYLVYSKGGNKYALYNIEEQKEETVLTGNFVDFDKTGKLLFREDKVANSYGSELKVYDPITFTWQKSNVYHYTFVSPDGKLYAKTNLRTRYYNKIIKEEITKEEFIKFRKEFCYGTEIENKRKSFIIRHRPFFEACLKENSLQIENIQRATYPNFCSLFLEIKHYVVIGVESSSQELEIELGKSLQFLNYVAFSYDNKFVGIVGKPDNNGYLRLVKIDYNENNNSLLLEKEICDTQIARKATWICAFTKKGLFGTYDSAPNLYLIDISEFDKFNSKNMRDFSFLKSQFCIPGRNLLCFSPSGNLMALSSQGYEAKSLGGKGHTPSNEVFIYTTDTRKLLASWADQSKPIGFRNISNAGFSIDETKLMTVSDDGVVVVRNLKSSICNFD